ncbi:hypothetical protein [Atlantibacter hermannii]|uniref:hypothetical protein n=1 Tax=Atlantibacter hermannii TaxID=565 RepID=UPI002899BC02|nr:hypothetical protein [Atlantibacter hermannii]
MSFITFFTACLLILNKNRGLIMFERIIKKDGLVIAIGTIVIYAATYFLERGYCSALGIPLDYIQITIPTIVNDFISFYLFLVPMSVITIVIMLQAERNENKGWHSLSHLLCGFFYAALMFCFVEKTFQSAFLCLFMGGLYFVLITFRDNLNNDDSPLKIFYSTLIFTAMTAFVFSFTFIVIGRSLAESGSFQTYSKDGRSYSLLKVYGEDAFMRELNKDKSKGDLIYFNTKDMTGMTLKADN